LSDPEKRVQYDKFGTSFEGAAPGGQGFSGFNWQNINLMMLLVLLLAILEIILAKILILVIFFRIFGGSARPKRKTSTQNKGRDLEIATEITLEEAAFGTRKEISFKTYLVCDHCHGKGYEPNSEVRVCPQCKGEGVVREARRTMLGTFTQIIECPKCHGRAKFQKNLVKFAEEMVVITLPKQ